MRVCANCEEIDATLQLYSSPRGFHVRLCADCALLPVVNEALQELKMRGYAPVTRIEMLPEITPDVAGALIFWLFGPHEDCGDEEFIAL